MQKSIVMYSVDKVKVRAIWLRLSCNPNDCREVDVGRKRRSIIVPELNSCHISHVLVARCSHSDFRTSSALRGSCDASSLGWVCEGDSLGRSCASAVFVGLLIADPSTASESIPLRSDATPGITCVHST